MRQRYENKKLIFETKLIKYSNLIECLQNFVAKPHCEELKQKCVSAQKQVELIVNNKIIYLSRTFYDQDAKFSKVRDDLVKEMQEDLKKYYVCSFSIAKFLIKNP